MHVWFKGSQREGKSLARNQGRPKEIRKILTSKDTGPRKKALKTGRREAGKREEVQVKNGRGPNQSERWS